MPARAGLIVLAFAALVFLTFQYPMDDAFISFRYARHLAEGHGLVFNPGERVEGFSNLSWTLLVAGAIAAGFDALRAAQVLGVLCTLGTAAALLRLTRIMPPCPSARPGRAAISIALLLTNMSVLFYTASGMETMFFALLLTGALLLHQNELQRLEDATNAPAPWSSALFALLAATRPEGLLYFAPAAALTLLRTVARRRHWKYAALSIVTCAVPSTLLLAWRLAYYGRPLPNTYYAKLGLGQPLASGFRYVADYLWFGGGATLVICALLLVLAERRWRYLAFAGAIAVGVFVALAAGGDWFPYSRLLTPSIPLLGFLAQEGLAVLGWRISRRDRSWGIAAPSAGAAALLVVGAFSPYAFLSAPDSYSVPLSYSFRRILADPRNTIADQWGKWRQPLMGEIVAWFRREGPPSGTLVVTEAGSVPYHLMGYRVIDLWGLTDRFIADQVAADSGRLVPYIRHIRPDFILLSYSGDASMVDFAALVDDPEMRRLYEPVQGFAYIVEVAFGHPESTERWVLFRRLGTPRGVPQYPLGFELDRLWSDPARVLTVRYTI